ncbi:O-antigen ligase family protein [Streptomyces sp. LHD-70]|uniref:O-antigen ligase family protein n=1 Tax=Streptomyces sp. LHD-70 TaxID=3072140 RepID=UPI00280FA312|nr:O-antigen ligase family protein [Streptomyces sp. LHD-70]MDQ8704027.1 O-antigen ligase family protein [Streptomyces sp. LHD-70]
MADLVRARPQWPTVRGGQRSCHAVALVLLAAPILLLALPYTGGDATTVDVTPADVGSALLVCFCGVQVLRGRARPLTPAAAVVFAAPTVALAAAAVTAADPVTALPGLARYLQIFVLVPAAVVLLVRDARDFRLVAASLVLLAVVEGAVGLHQYVTGTGASYMGQDIRAVGTFGATDVMGMATVVALGTVVAAALALRPPARHPRWYRPALLVIACVLCVPLVLSFSRGAWIATVPTLLVLVAFTGWRRLVQFLAAAIAVVVVLVGGFGVGSSMLNQRLSSITQVTDAPDQSVTDRYTMWAAASGMWQENPVTGVGLKGFATHRDAYSGLALSAGSDTAGAGRDFHRQPLLSPHNMYLLVLSEQGLLGVVGLVGSWLALLVLALRRTWRCLFRGLGTSADCGLVAVGLLAWQLIDFLYADIGGPSTALTGMLFGLCAWWALASRAGEDGHG